MKDTYNKECLGDCIIHGAKLVFMEIIMSILHGFCNKQRLNNVLDAILPVLVAGIIGGGYIHLFKIDAETYHPLHNLVNFYCADFSIAILIIKQILKLD